MKHVDYLGDSRLRHKIVYDKDTYSECIYCGKEAKTREHVPSKVFLSKPYPDNLGIVPACYECNKSFSKNELFLALIIELLKWNYYGDSYIIDEDTKGRINYNKTLVENIQSAIRNNTFEQFEERVVKIIFKLAVGHAVFELSEGYCIKNGEISYSFFDTMSDEEIEDFTLPFNVGGEPVPEVGSRVFDRILFIDLNLASVEDSEQKTKLALVLLDWVDVQDNKYMYTCSKFGNKIVVKMVISDFLYTEIIINTEENID